MNKKFLYIGCMALTMSFTASVKTMAQESRDSLVNVAFGTVDREDLVHAISTVNKRDLSDVLFDNGTLTGVQGAVAGYNGNVWGQGALVLVDGVPRSASNVKATEIESVTVMKDAAAVALYGSRAAKGVVLITTKRGKNAPMTIDFRGNVGFSTPKSFPKYLDSDCYMTMYNEACRNDGIAEKYSANDIYQSQVGTNPYRYPNINFYSSDYLRDASFQANAEGEVYGGNDKTHYYVDFGMNYNNSLLKYGENKDAYDLNFNVRGNVDMTLAPWLRATTNAAVLFNNNYAGRGNFWGAASTLRPNWFAPLLPIDMMDRSITSVDNAITNSNHVIGGKYLLGGTSADTTNPFSELLAAGYTREKSRVFMFDVALMADLSSVLKGLSFKTSYALDYTAYYSEAFADTYAVYEPTWANVNGKDVIVDLKQYNEDKKATNEYVGKSTYDQTMTFSAQFDYKNTFDRLHNVSATLLGWGYQTQGSADENHAATGQSTNGSSYHKTSNVNLGLNAAYNYDHKYYFDFSGAVVHSAKLPAGNRNAFSPSFTLGWRLSKEKFMKDVKFVDDLKLTASYANLHQDLDISDYYLYKGYYIANGGWYQWHDGVAGGNTAGSGRGDNPDLTFITRKEWRVGLDATLFNKLLWINANFFTQKTNGMLTRGASTIFPSYMNNGDHFTFLPYINNNADKRTGFDFSVVANKKFGEWDITMGVNGMFFSSKATKRDEVNEYGYQNAKGHALDAVRGYVCEGFFQSQEEIDNSPKQSFGGTLKPGDLKYKDINEDGVVDSKDQIDLGKGAWSVAPFTYGINLKVKYKNFSLYLLGNGQSGAIGMKNNSYWWNRGSSKFSEVVLQRWTPETAATATYPRLTTTNGDNNYRNSTFWKYSTDQFRLTNAQFTYDLPKSLFDGLFIHGASVYVGGSNLLTIAKEREYIDMSLGYPNTSNFYFGFKAQF